MSRDVPTPGSTTATWIVPAGNSGVTSASAMAPLADVLRRDGVREVDDLRRGVDREDDALHRGDVGAAFAEVGGERDEGHGRGSGCVVSGWSVVRGLEPRIGRVLNIGRLGGGPGFFVQKVLILRGVRGAGCDRSWRDVAQREAIGAEFWIKSWHGDGFKTSWYWNDRGMKAAGSAGGRYQTTAIRNASTGRAGGFRRDGSCSGARASLSQRGWPVFYKENWPIPCEGCAGIRGSPLPWPLPVEGRGDRGNAQEKLVLPRTRRLN